MNVDLKIPVVFGIEAKNCHKINKWYLPSMKMPVQAFLKFPHMCIAPGE